MKKKLCKNLLWSPFARSFLNFYLIDINKNIALMNCSGGKKNVSLTKKKSLTVQKFIQFSFLKNKTIYLRSSFGLRTNVDNITCCAQKDCSFKNISTFPTKKKRKTYIYFQLLIWKFICWREYYSNKRNNTLFDQEYFRLCKKKNIRNRIFFNYSENCHKYKIVFPSSVKHSLTFFNKDILVGQGTLGGCHSASNFVQSEKNLTQKYFIQNNSSKWFVYSFAKKSAFINFINSTIIQGITKSYNDQNSYKLHSDLRFDESKIQNDNLLVQKIIGTTHEKILPWIKLPFKNLNLTIKKENFFSYRKSFLSYWLLPFFSLVSCMTNPFQQFSTHFLFQSFSQPSNDRLNIGSSSCRIEDPIVDDHFLFLLKKKDKNETKLFKILQSHESIHHGSIRETETLVNLDNFSKSSIQRSIIPDGRIDPAVHSSKRFWNLVQSRYKNSSEIISQNSIGIENIILYKLYKQSLLNWNWQTWKLKINQSNQRNSSKLEFHSSKVRMDFINITNVQENSRNDKSFQISKAAQEQNISWNYVNSNYCQSKKLFFKQKQEFLNNIIIQATTKRKKQEIGLAPIPLIWLKSYKGFLECRQNSFFIEKKLYSDPRFNQSKTEKFPTSFLLVSSLQNSKDQFLKNLNSFTFFDIYEKIAHNKKNDIFVRNSNGFYKTIDPSSGLIHSSNSFPESIQTPDESKFYKQFSKALLIMDSFKLRQILDKTSQFNRSFTESIRSLNEDKDFKNSKIQENCESKFSNDFMIFKVLQNYIDKKKTITVVQKLSATKPQQFILARIAVNNKNLQAMSAFFYKSDGFFQLSSNNNLLCHFVMNAKNLKKSIRTTYECSEAEQKKCIARENLHSKKTLSYYNFLNSFLSNKIWKMSHPLLIGSLKNFENSVYKFPFVSEKSEIIQTDKLIEEIPLCTKNIKKYHSIIINPFENFMSKEVRHIKQQAFSNILLFFSIKKYIQIDNYIYYIFSKIKNLTIQKNFENIFRQTKFQEQKRKKKDIVIQQIGGHYKRLYKILQQPVGHWTVINKTRNKQYQENVSTEFIRLPYESNVFSINSNKKELQTGSIIFSLKKISSESSDNISDLQLSKINSINLVKNFKQKPVFLLRHFLGKQVQLARSSHQGGSSHKTYIDVTELKQQKYIMINNQTNENENENEIQDIYLTKKNSWIHLSPTIMLQNRCFIKTKKKVKSSDQFFENLQSSLRPQTNVILDLEKNRPIQASLNFPTDQEIFKSWSFNSMNRRSECHQLFDIFFQNEINYNLYAKKELVNNTISRQNFKNQQKKRRMKKQRRETRRRKKRKRFFPRLLWLRFNLYEKFLKKQHFYRFTNFASVEHFQELFGQKNSENSPSVQKLLEHCDVRKLHSDRFCRQRGSIVPNFVKSRANISKYFSNTMSNLSLDNCTNLLTLRCHIKKLRQKEFFKMKHLQPILNRLQSPFGPWTNVILQRFLNYYQFIEHLQNQILKYFADVFIYSQIINQTHQIKLEKLSIFNKDKTFLKWQHSYFIAKGFWAEMIFSPIIFSKMKLKLDLSDRFLNIFKNNTELEECNDLSVFFKIPVILKPIEHSHKSERQLFKDQFNLVMQNKFFEKRKKKLQARFQQNLKLKNSTTDRNSLDDSNLKFKNGDLSNEIQSEQNSIKYNLLRTSPYFFISTQIRSSWALNKTNVFLSAAAYKGSSLSGQSLSYRPEFSFHKFSLKDIWTQEKNRDQLKSNKTKKLFYQIKKKLLRFCQTPKIELDYIFYLKKLQHFEKSLPFEQVKISATSPQSFNKLEPSNDQLDILKTKKQYSIEDFELDRAFSFFKNKEEKIKNVFLLERPTIRCTNLNLSQQKDIETIKQEQNPFSFWWMHKIGMTLYSSNSFLYYLKNNSYFRSSVSFLPIKFFTLQSSESFLRRVFDESKIMSKKNIFRSFLQKSIVHRNFISNQEPILDSTVIKQSHKNRTIERSFYLIFDQSKIHSSTIRMDTMKKQRTQIHWKTVVFIFCSFLFHICTLFSLITISQIRCILKFYFLLFNKISESFFKIFFSVFNSIFQNLIIFIFSKLIQKNSSAIFLGDLYSSFAYFVRLEQNSVPISLQSSNRLLPVNIMLNIQESIGERSIYLLTRISQQNDTNLGSIFDELKIKHFEKILSVVMTIVQKPSELFKRSYNVQKPLERLQKSNISISFTLQTVKILFNYICSGSEWTPYQLYNFQFLKISKSKILYTGFFNQLKILYKFYKKTSFFVFFSFINVINILESWLRLFYIFLEKPAEFMVDWIAQLFLIEWSSDLIPIIPDSFEFTIWEFFIKITRSFRFFGPFGYLIEKIILNFFEIICEILYQPDTDLISRQKKGIIFWDFLLQESLNSLGSDFIFKSGEIPMFITGFENLTKQEKSETSSLQSSKQDLNIFQHSPKLKHFEKILSVLKNINISKLGLGQVSVFNFSYFSLNLEFTEILSYYNKLQNGSYQFDLNLIVTEFENCRLDWKYSEIPMFLWTNEINKAQNLEDFIFFNKNISHITKSKRWSVNQYFTFASKLQPDLFIDVYLPKSFLYILPNFVGIQHISGQLYGIPDIDLKNFIELKKQPTTKMKLLQRIFDSSKTNKKLTLGSIFPDGRIDPQKYILIQSHFDNLFSKPIMDSSTFVTTSNLICQIYSGLFYKQTSKNILVIGSEKSDKKLLIQAIAGETELKIITDNANRYTLVLNGLPVGIRLLKEVFDAIVLHTPCLFLLEEIHVIGERRSSLISEDNNISENTFETEKEDIHEKNKILYTFSRHKISYYKKSKVDTNLTVKSNKKMLKNFFGSYSNNKFTKEIGSEQSDETFLSQNYSGPVHPLLLDDFEDKKMKDDFSYQLNKNVTTTNSPFDNCKNLSSNQIELKYVLLRMSANHKKHLRVGEYRKKIKKTFLELDKNVLLAPPTTSPFTILVMKELKKFKAQKIVNQLSWTGLPMEQLVLMPRLSYSIKAKVLFLVEKAIENLYVKVNMITDLLLIIDNVRSHRGFVVFATTHIPGVLDPALRRPGRFDETISLPFIGHFKNRLETTIKFGNSFKFQNKNLSPKVCLQDSRSFLNNLQSSRIFDTFLHSSGVLQHSKSMLDIKGMDSVINISELCSIEKQFDLRFIEDRFSNKTFFRPILEYFSLLRFHIYEKITNFVTEIFYDPTKPEKINLSQIYATSSIQSRQSFVNCDFLFEVFSYQKKNHNYRNNTQVKKLFQSSNRFGQNSLLLRQIIPFFLYQFDYQYSFSNSFFINKKLQTHITLEDLVDSYWHVLDGLNSSEFQMDSVVPIHKNDFQTTACSEAVSCSFAPVIQKTPANSKALKVALRAILISSPSLIRLRNNMSLQEPLSAPFSRIILPSRRFENYKRAEKDYQYKVFFSIKEKIKLHQNKKKIQQLYNIKKEKKDFSFDFKNKLILDFDKYNNNPISTNSYYKNKILNRHRLHLINQWWNGQLGEHNKETTFASDLDWRIINPILFNIKDEQSLLRFCVSVNNLPIHNLQQLEQVPIPAALLQSSNVFLSVIKDFSLEQNNKLGQAEISETLLQSSNKFLDIIKLYEELLNSKKFNILIDFPDCEQFYNPKQRRWLVTNGYWSYWFDSKTIGKEHSFIPYNKNSKYCFNFNKKREELDYLGYKLLQKGILKKIDLNFNFSL